MKAIFYFASLTVLLLSLLPFRSEGQQWERVEAVPATQITDLFSAGDTLFAAGLDKVYFSFDGGESWDSSAVILNGLDYITGLQFVQGRLYVATLVEGFFRSDDGGQSWHTDNAGLTGLGSDNLSSLAVRGDSLFAGTIGAGVFVKKISAKSDWSAYKTNLPWQNIECLENIGGTLYAGAGGSATFSRQAAPGHAWEEVPFDVFDGLLNIFLGIEKQGDVLLGAGSLGLYRSEDGGDTWTYYNPGAGVVERARFVTLGSRTVVSLAKPSGVTFLLYTDDRGISWQPFEPPLGGSVGYDLAVAKGQLYAARSNGLWRIAQSTPVREPVQAQATLGQNYPNPFSEETVIPLQLPQSGQVELAVFDKTGRLLQTLWQGEQVAGLHELRFRAGNLPPGTYYVRLVAGNGVATRSMVIVR